jgi:hypothetical protein
MSWKKVILTGDQVIQGHLERILHQYMPIMAESKNANLVAPLMGNASDDGTTNVYFPPGSSPFWDKILFKYGAFPCDAPTEPVTPMVRHTGSKFNP